MAKPFIIGITGGSGSGKTSIIRAIQNSFSEKEVCVMSQDEYYFTLEYQKKDKNGIENFDRPNSINNREFLKDIKKLLAGNTIFKEEYLFNNKNAKPQIHTYAPTPILVIEGIFIFHHKKLRKLMDLKVFVQAKENLKVIRRIKRDRVERGYPLDDVLYRYEHHILPSFEKYILPYRDNADIVINNNDHFENGVEVLKGFIKCKLEELKKVK